LEFTCQLIAFRNQHPIFHRAKFFQGQPILGNTLKDINWLRADGQEMQSQDWQDHVRSLGVLLCGDDIGLETFEGQSVTDDTFYLCFNSYHEGVIVRLPGDRVVSWQRIIDTSQEPGFLENAELVDAGNELIIPGRSLIVMKQVAGSDDDAKKTSTGKPIQPAANLAQGKASEREIPKAEG
jgi:glycogen operon protein